MKTNAQVHLRKALALLGNVRLILSSCSEVALLLRDEAELLEEFGEINHLIDISIGYKDNTAFMCLCNRLQAERSI